MKFLVVYQPATTGYGAYVPDLPGCVSTGETPEAGEANVREAIGMHLEAMRNRNEPIPEPMAWAGIIEV